MKKLIVGIVALAAIGVGLYVYAGASYKSRCSNKQCDFELSSGFGGGMAFEQVQGYCKKCDKMVTLSWSRMKPGERQEPIAVFWDPATGTTRKLYKCPDCGGAFVNLEKAQDFRYCPKCGKETMEHELRAHYD